MPDPSQPRAVVDTSVLISTHRHAMWLLASQDFYEGVWGTFIVGELVRVRTLMSLDKDPTMDRGVLRDRLNDLVDAFTRVFEIADHTLVPDSPSLRDPFDVPVLRTAVAADAAIVVSLNTEDFPPDRVLAGIRFMTPEEFYVFLEGIHSASGLSPKGLAAGAGRQLP